MKFHGSVLIADGQAIFSSVIGENNSSLALPVAGICPPQGLYYSTGEFIHVNNGHLAIYLLSITESALACPINVFLSVTKGKLLNRSVQHKDGDLAGILVGLTSEDIFIAAPITTSKRLNDATGKPIKTTSPSLSIIKIHYNASVVPGKDSMAHILSSELALDNKDSDAQRSSSLFTSQHQDPIASDHKACKISALSALEDPPLLFTLSEEETIPSCSVIPNKKKFFAPLTTSKTSPSYQPEKDKTVIKVNSKITPAKKKSRSVLKFHSIFPEDISGNLS